MTREGLDVVPCGANKFKPGNNQLTFKCGALENTNPLFLDLNVVLLETQNYTKHFKCGAFGNNNPSFSKAPHLKLRNIGLLFPTAPHLVQEKRGHCFQKHHI